MFRCHSIVWFSIIWALIFSYTLMTHLKTSRIARTSVLATSAILIVLGSALLVYEKATKHIKILLWFATWSFFILLGLIFFTEGYFKGLTLNIWITSFTMAASIFWFRVSHTDQITEPGLHWYIWSLTSIITVSSAFNSTSATAITVHIVICVLLSVVNICYLVYIYKIQSRNNRRCRQLWRVASCFVVSTGFITGSILYKSEVLTSSAWSEYIMATQVVAFVVVLVDSLIGIYARDARDVYSDELQNKNKTDFIQRGDV